MSATYPIGSRVVCPDPDGGWFVGTVAHIDGAELTIVYSPTQVVRASAGEVRPVMPRSSADLDRFGAFWWCDGTAVKVVTYIGPLRVHWPGDSEVKYEVDPSRAWSGPVQPPPVVRG